VDLRETLPEDVEGDTPLAGGRPHARVSAESAIEERYGRRRREEEGGGRKEEGGRRKEEGGRRKEEGGKREGGGRKEEEEGEEEGDAYCPRMSRGILHLTGGDPMQGYLQKVPLRKGMREGGRGKKRDERGRGKEEEGRRPQKVPLRKGMREGEGSERQEG
jgi:hypothetical protein